MEKKKLKVFLGTPAYSGKVNAQYAISLCETQRVLEKEGIDLFIQVNCSGSLLVAERNRIITHFMESDCTHLLCIDCDLGWPAHCLPALIQHDVDFVAGVYPSRKGGNFYFRPRYNADTTMMLKNNLIGGEYVPAGFMLLKREAIAKMIEHFSHLRFEPKKDSPNASSGYALFNTEVFDGEFWGEDYVFCRRAREAGIDIWIDPFIQFDHDGIVGTLSDALSKASIITKEDQDVSNK